MRLSLLLPLISACYGVRHILEAALHIMNDAEDNSSSIAMASLSTPCKIANQACVLVSPCEGLSGDSIHSVLFSHRLSVELLQKLVASQIASKQGQDILPHDLLLSHRRNPGKTFRMRTSSGQPVFLASASSYGLQSFPNRPIEIQCRLSAKAGGPGLVGGAIGGTNAVAGEADWAVLLTKGMNYEKTRSQLKDAGRTVRDKANCGGTLIHRQWVLTAAHCVWGPAEASKITREDFDEPDHKVHSRIGVIVGVKDVSSWNSVIDYQMTRRNRKEIKWGDFSAGILRRSFVKHGWNEKDEGILFKLVHIDKGRPTVVRLSSYLEDPGGVTEDMFPIWLVPKQTLYRSVEVYVHSAFNWENNTALLADVALIKLENAVDSLDNVALPRLGAGFLTPPGTPFRVTGWGYTSEEDIMAEQAQTVTVNYGVDAKNSRCETPEDRDADKEKLNNICKGGAEMFSLFRKFLNDRLARMEEVYPDEDDESKTTARADLLDKCPPAEVGKQVADIVEDSLLYLCPPGSNLGFLSEARTSRGIRNIDSECFSLVIAAQNVFRGLWSKTQLCASHEEAAPCHGDSGSALYLTRNFAQPEQRQQTTPSVTFDAKCASQEGSTCVRNDHFGDGIDHLQRDLVVGIVSSGERDVCEKGNMVVYTDVAPFLNWIHKLISMEGTSEVSACITPERCCQNCPDLLMDENDENEAEQQDENED